MSLLDLIQTKPEDAQTAIFNTLNNKAFDYFDNYKLDETVHQTVQESYNDDFDNEELDELDEGSGQKEKQHDKYVPLTQRTEIGRKVIADQKAKEPGKALLKKITKEDFDAMTQEEFDAIDEEQLDELSKDTLLNYSKKALKDKTKNNSAAINNKLVGREQASNDHLALANKRERGLSNARSKLTKEDFDAMTQEEFDAIDEEQLDELSLATLNSYRNKKLKQGANTSNSSGIMTAYKKVQKIQNATKPSMDAQTQGDLRGGKY